MSSIQENEASPQERLKTLFESFQKGIEHFEKTGEVLPALYPGFDQNGDWKGIPPNWGVSPALKALKINPEKLRRVDPQGQIHLLCSYIEDRSSLTLASDKPSGEKGSLADYRQNLVSIAGTLSCQEEGLLSFPKLEKVAIDFSCPTAKEVNCPSLRGLGGEIYAQCATRVCLPKLQASSGIHLELTEAFIAPELETIFGELQITNATEIDLSNLRQVNGRFINWAGEEIQIPKLESVSGNLWINSPTIHMPRLRSIGKDLIITALQEISTAGNLEIGGNLCIEGMLGGKFTQATKKLLSNIKTPCLHRWLDQAKGLIPLTPPYEPLTKALVSAISSELTQRDLKAQIDKTALSLS